MRKHTKQEEDKSLKGSHNHYYGYNLVINILLDIQKVNFVINRTLTHGTSSDIVEFNSR